MTTEGAGPVVIVGGGIAGLTLALALARNGVASTVLERAEALERTGAGIQLSPNAGNVLAALGLGPALDSVAARPRQLSITSGASGQTVATIPYGDTGRRYGTPYRTIHRGDLQRVLLEAATDSALVQMVFGQAALAIDQDDRGVRIETAAGLLAAPLAIGADGVASLVRGHVRPGERRAPAAFDAWRATVPAPDSIARDETAIALAPGSHVVRYALGDGETLNLVAVMRTEAPAAGGPDDRRAHAAHRMPDAARTALLAHPWHATLAAADGDWRRWPLVAVSPDLPWHRGRVALAGDAAHAMLPFMAQGGAMAIEDAAVLAAMVRRLGPGPAALATYAAARRPRVALVARETVRTGRIYHLRPPFSYARDLAMRSLGPHRLLARLDWLYGWRPPDT